MSGTVGVQVINKGLIAVRDTTTVSRILCDLQNYGSIVVQQGTLALSAGTNWNTTTVQSGAVLQVDAPANGNNASFFYDRSSTVVVAGKMFILGGKLIISGTYDATGGSTVVTSGMLDVRAEATVIDLGAPFAAQGGTANFNCRALSLTSMQMGLDDGSAAGTVIADGHITVLSTLAFNGGSLQGRGNTQVLGSATFATLMPKNIQSHKLQLSGASSWTGGSIALSNGASFVVEPSATFSIETFSTMTDSTGDSEVMNYGTIQQTSSSCSSSGVGSTLSPRVRNYATSTHTRLPFFLRLGLTSLPFTTVSALGCTLAINVAGTQVNGTFRTDGGALYLSSPAGSAVFLDPTTTISGSTGTVVLPSMTYLSCAVATNANIQITGTTTILSAKFFTPTGNMAVGVGGASQTSGLLVFGDVATNNLPALGT